MNLDECKDPYPCTVVDRELTDDERMLAVWMLVNGNDDARAFLPELENARVCGLCGCGCASIDFRIDGKDEPAVGIRVLGDFLFVQGDETCGVFIFEQERVHSGIEVFGYGNIDVVKELPKPSQLRKYEDGE